LPCSSPRGEAGAGIRTAELGGYPPQLPSAQPSLFIREAQGQPPTITEQRVPGIPSSSMPVHKGRMLGPFDWCTVIGIGIAAGILGIVLLIGWRQGPPRA